MHQTRFNSNINIETSATAPQQMGAYTVSHLGFTSNPSFIKTPSGPGFGQQSFLSTKSGGSKPHRLNEGFTDLNYLPSDMQ